MRRFLVKIAVFLAIISMFSSIGNSNNAFVLSDEAVLASTVVYGDVNGDGKITASDARLVLLASAHLQTGIDTTLADVDNDGKVTAIDARYILRASALLDNITCIRFGHNIKNGACVNCQYAEETTTVPETTTIPESTTEITTKVPETTTKKPETTTKAPVTTTKAPETTTKAPVTTTKAPETTTRTPVATDNLVNEIFEGINEYRASLGLYPLKFNAELSKITTVRAKEASVYWSHTRPDGRSFWTVFDDYNKFTNVQVGEILAKIGAPVATRAVNGWINSPSHNAILTTTRYTEIGIAYYEYNGYWYVAAHTI